MARIDPPLLDVVVVGQTPPPVHGQSAMIERIVHGRYRRVRVHHVRMAFSESIAEIGVPSAGKVAHLAALVARIGAARLGTRSPVLYYPPAGPKRVPLLRDLALLSAVRPLFPHVLFHFHAGGVTDLYPQLGALERRWFDWALGKPDVAIRPSASNPPDGERLGARADLVIPHGLEDCARIPPGTPNPFAAERSAGDPRLLFVGMVAEEKGVSVLLDACALLARRGSRFTLEVMGAFRSADYEAEARRRVREGGLSDRVRFLGPLSGDAKWSAFRRASVLCFPTHYESETFGLVALEAMQFALPVVATRWRGVPSVVRDGETGSLVPIRDPGALADAIEAMLVDPGRRAAFGRAAREVFLREHSLEVFEQRMEAAFLLAAGLGSSARPGR